MSTESNGLLFGKENYMLMALGAVFILVGFLLMIGGSSKDPNVFNAEELYSFRRITLAPIVVFIGLVTEVFAIFWRSKQASGSTELVQETETEEED